VRGKKHPQRGCFEKLFPARKFIRTLKKKKDGEARKGDKRRLKVQEKIVAAKSYLISAEKKYDVWART